MHYATPLLHISADEIMHQAVVCVENGCVLSVSPFSVELHSLMFVNEIYLASSPSIATVEELKTGIFNADDNLYAYAVGERARLELLD